MAASGASWGSLLGTGAGMVLGGPLGSALGGLAGSAIGGLFDEEQEVPSWQNYSDPRIASIIQRLMRQNQGERNAANTAGRNTRNVNRQMERLENDPNFSGNAITKANLFNQMTLDAEGANVNARLAGAQQDQQAQMQAAQLQQGQQAFAGQRNAFEQGRYQLQQQPTGLDTLAGNALGFAMGNALGGGKEPKTTPRHIDPATGLPWGSDPNMGPEQIMSQMQTGGLYAPFRGRMDDRTLSSTLSQGQGFQFNPPQFNPYQLGPAPSSMFNYGYGYNPLGR